MGAWLLDVNVLIATLWPPHDFHDSAMKWILAHRSEPWATCALTETGFLRVVTGRGFSEFAPSFEEAAEMLILDKQARGSHCFWPSEVSCEDLLSTFGDRISGHQQITDAYLLALAMHHGGRLLTFDQRMSRLAPEGTPEASALFILAP
jgi:toxin-antitoxin system PIN domain toxin